MPPSKGARTFLDPGGQGIVLTDATDLAGAQASGRWVQTDTVVEARQ